MKKQFLSGKHLEYMGHLTVAQAMEDREAIKSAYLRLIIVERMLSRMTASELIEIDGRIRTANRIVEKCKQSGTALRHIEEWLNQLRARRKSEAEYLSALGGSICTSLDTWQEHGATLKDLCNLCCCDYAQVVSTIDNADTERFSSLIFIHNLDFKSTADFIDYEVDAPLTHAIKEYYLGIMLNTEAGQAASSAALQEVFPELWENAMTLTTDADGNQYLVDKDGVSYPVSEERSANNDHQQ